MGFLQHSQSCQVGLLAWIAVLSRRGGDNSYGPGRRGWDGMLHGAGYLLHLTEQMSHHLKPQGAYKNSVTSVALWRLSPAVGAVLGWDSSAEHWECQRAAACLAVLVAVHQPFAHANSLPRKLFMDCNQAASCLPLQEL